MRDEERRARGRVFGEVAELYEQARPSYPAALVADVIAAIGRPAPRVLEVGAGTGKATRLFAPAVHDLLALGPDPEMAAIARRECAALAHVEVVESDFEHWRPAEVPFDALIAGQSWHWVDPAIGFAKARDVLAPDGVLAAFWNVPQLERSPLIADFDAAYQRHAPTLHRKSATTCARYDGLLEHHPGFRLATQRTYTWEQRYSASEYGTLIRTHSDHHLLPPDQLAALVDAVRAVIDDAGGTFVLEFDTVLGVLVPDRAH
jgi:SAM-dependent methyltransferase